MHHAQKQFCRWVKQKYPHHFKGKKVLDCGSLDVNGNNRYLFDDCDYLGIDIGEGPNVDVVSFIHLYRAPDESFDTIISTECFEHDRHYAESLSNITRMLKPGGMFLFTCATTGRQEHGTSKIRPGSSPFTNDYYKNLTEQDIRLVMDTHLFAEYEFQVKHTDLYFYGIK